MAEAPPSRFTSPFYLLISSLFLLAACAAAPTATPTPASWTTTTVAFEAHRDAPVVWRAPEGFAAAWIGADDAGVHQDARLVRNGTPAEVVVLPLPPDHPYSQQSAPAGANNLHLFWLDTGEDGSNSLYSAVLTPDLQVSRGPTHISDGLTLRYSLAPLDGGAVWAAWSGGVIAEPAIYMQYVDDDGRPRLAERAVLNADFPALARSASGGVWLFWLDGSSGRLMRGAWSDTGLANGTAVAQGMRLEPGDRLVSLSTALDTTHGYAFWNLTRVDGQDETWLSMGEIAADTWSPPQRLALADDSELSVRWATPLAGQGDSLPVAAQVGTELRVLWFQAGALVRSETVAALTADLLAPPGIYRDGASLLVAWSEPTPDGLAALNVAVQP